MTQHRRNILLGLTVALSLALLAWMILRFSDAPFKLFAPTQMPITLDAISSEGITEGSPVYYKGVNVGRVLRLERSHDQKSVQIQAVVDQNPPLPGNLEAKIRTTIFGGTSSIILQLRFPVTRPSTVATEVPGAEEAEPEPDLVHPLHANQHIGAKFVGIDLMPKEFTNLANDLKLTSYEVRAFAHEFREAKLFDEVRKNLTTLHASLESAGRAFESADKLLGDEKMRKNLTQSLENFHVASESVVRIGQDLEKLSAKANTHVDELANNGNKVLVSAREEIQKRSNQLGDRLEQLAGVLQSVDQIARKVNEGKGTAGALVNDPALYENLLDTSKELKLTIQDLRRLVDQWETEGLSFKLK